MKVICEYADKCKSSCKHKIPHEPKKSAWILGCDCRFIFCSDKSVCIALEENEKRNELDRILNIC